jgi:N-acetylglucosaminyl-diphospho-decaprenol L-rhamnosyltransferase
MDAVTVTTNDREDLERFLADELLMGSFDRVIVVDNASDDGSPELARDAGCVVVTKPRGGYGEAINAGSRHVRGDFFAVLNADVRFLSGDTISRLAHHFMHPQVGIVAPALELLDGRLQDSARRTPTPLNLIFRRWIGAERGVVRRGGDVEWTVGAFWLVRRSVWERLGGFDERYFLYFDDVDYCHRLRAAGGSVRFDPTVRAVHAFGAASRRPLTAWATRHHVRSAQRFFTEHPRYLLDPRPGTIGPPERRSTPRLPERRSIERLSARASPRNGAMPTPARSHAASAV